MNKRKNQPQTLKGFRDLLPEKAKVRQRVVATLREVFQSYGFEPLETPALEYAELLLNKYGEEVDKLVYTFKDKGGRQVGLRYDLTVPAARVLAQYANQLTLPFKRYQIQPVWRAEKPQRGRFREFTQCDIDIFGTTSPLADAEVIAVTFAALKKLGFEKFEIKINSRQILFSVLQKAGVEKESQQLSAIRSIDKLDKKSPEEVKTELIKKGFPVKQVEEILASIKKANLSDDPNLEKLVGFLESMQVPLKLESGAGYRFDPALARGLDYYTGPIFEVVLEGSEIGSIAGGGRYDQLISELGGPDTPATGIAFGLDRICEAAEKLGLLKESRVTPRVLITFFPGFENQSLKLFSELREKGTSCELYPDPEAKISKQMKYADRKGFDYVIFQGADEVKDGQLTVKDLNKEEKETGQKISKEALFKLLSR